MWVTESFSSLELLLDFLNDRRIVAERCKVVFVPGADGVGVWHLIYQVEEGERGLAAVAEEDALVVANDAVASAEAIISDAQRDDEPTVP
jgi:hypothetical protein